MLVMLPGCSDDGGNAGQEGSTAPEEQAASGEGTAEATPIKVITYNQNKPFCYLDENGDLAGYDVDSLKLCEEKLGGKYQFSFDSMDFNAMIGSLQSNACDVVSCALARTADRLEKFVFPEEAYCLNPMVLAVREDSGITRLADMAGKHLLANPVNAYYQALLKYNEMNPDAAIIIDDIEGSVGNADLFRMVANGQTDAVVCFRSGFDDIQEAAGTSLVATEVALTCTLYYMARAGQAELAADLSSALKQAKEDGSLGELAEKWFGEDIFSLYVTAEGADIVLEDGTVYSVATDGILGGGTSDDSDGSDDSDDAEA